MQERYLKEPEMIENKRRRAPSFPFEIVPRQILMPASLVGPVAAWMTLKEQVLNKVGSLRGTIRKSYS